MNAAVPAMSVDDLEAMAIFDQLWGARMARVRAQRERIDGIASWVGRQLSRHEITRDDVNRRLSALTAHRPIDDDAWCPWHLAEETATDALRRGMEAGR
jgi:hypothetical protein